MEDFPLQSLLSVAPLWLHCGPHYLPAGGPLSQGRPVPETPPWSLSTTVPPSSTPPTWTAICHQGMSNQTALKPTRIHSHYCWEAYREVELNPRLNNFSLSPPGAFSYEMEKIQIKSDIGLLKLLKGNIGTSVCMELNRSLIGRLECNILSLPT